MPETNQNDVNANIDVSTNPGESGNANLIYILYLVGLVLGIPTIIGIVMAYMSKNDAPDWLRSHYENQINIFWKGLLYLAIGAVLSLVLVGLLVLLATLIWYIVRVVKGMQALSRREAIAAPASWGF